jgi:hypothetical protein
MLYWNILYMLLRLITPSKIMCDFIEMMSLNMSNFAAGSSLLIQIQIAIVGIIIVLGIFFIWRAVSRIDQRLKIVEINQKTLSQCQNIAGLSNGGGSVSMDASSPSCPIKTSSGSCVYPQMKQTHATSPKEFRDIDEFSDEMLKVFGNDDDSEDDEDSEYITSTSTANIVITPIEIFTAASVTSSDPIKFADADAVVVTPAPPPSPSPPPPSPSPPPPPPPRPTASTNASPSTTVLSGTQIETKTSFSLNLEDDIIVDTESESGNPLSKSKLNGMNLEKLKAICTNHGLSTEGVKKVLITRILGESRE